MVKISDKISYLGRDIEDAFRLEFIGRSELKELIQIAHKYNVENVNTTALINKLITDLCNNSSPDNGLTLSNCGLDLLNDTKEFNYKYIYCNQKFEYYKKYVHLVLNSIFIELEKKYQGGDTFAAVRSQSNQSSYLCVAFSEWLALYCNQDIVPADLTHISVKANNRKTYKSLSSKEEYIHAIIDYIAGMTDQYAIKTFESLASF